MKRFRPLTLLPALGALLLVTPATVSADTPVTDFMECASLISPPVGDGSIVRALKRRGLTRESLYRDCTHPGGSQGARLCKFPDGSAYIIKMGAAAELETFAYRVDRKLRLGFVPQTEIFTFGTFPYSAQKFVVADATLGAISERPDTLYLFDALLLNADRMPDMHNYLRVTERATGLPRVIAIDNGLAFANTFAEWLKYASDLWPDSAMSEGKFIAIVKRNPEFVARLRAWKKDEILKELGGLIRHTETEGRRELELFTDMRAMILSIADDTYVSRLR